ncbi:MAG: hypothetical protein HYZ57_15970 [Acidobacteria bacterium]|nr:hypothetical protein [Acidobacteriota bacterium]
MSCYVSSSDNRFYVATEATYANVPAITAANRFPAVKLTPRHERVRPERRDKIGSRSFPGIPSGIRRVTSFSLRTYLTGWVDQSAAPSYGPLFEAALGAAARIWNGATVQSAAPSVRTITFTTAHGLSFGDAVAFGSEIRFVSAVVDTQTVELNAPFTIQPDAGALFGKTVAYRLASDLPSLSIFDYWSPATAVQRVLSGAAVDRFSVGINGDFHEFEFSGPAQDVLDSASFTEGQGGLAAFPAEPAVSALSPSIVPGHLGQVWMGNTPDRFYTLTSAETTLGNALEPRDREFGSDGPRCIVAGRRSVSLDFSLYSQPNDATTALYQAARQDSPLPVMFQLGQQPGQLFGLYMKSVLLEVPEFDDDENRVEWHFRKSRAQGAADDELVIAFA